MEHKDFELLTLSPSVRHTAHRPVVSTSLEPRLIVPLTPCLALPTVRTVDYDCSERAQFYRLNIFILEMKAAHYSGPHILNFFKWVVTTLNSFLISTHPYMCVYGTWLDHSNGRVYDDKDRELPIRVLELDSCFMGLSEVTRRSK